MGCSDSWRHYKYGSTKILEHMREDEMKNWFNEVTPLSEIGIFIMFDTPSGEGDNVKLPRNTDPN